MRTLLSASLILGLLSFGCKGRDENKEEALQDEQAQQRAEPQAMAQTEQAPPATGTQPEGTGLNEAPGTTPEQAPATQPDTGLTTPEQTAPAPGVAPTEDTGTGVGLDRGAPATDEPLQPGEVPSEDVAPGTPPETPQGTTPEIGTEPGIEETAPPIEGQAPEGNLGTPPAEPINQGGTGGMGSTGATGGDMGATAENEPAPQDTAAEDSAMTGRGAGTTGVGVTGSGEAVTVPTPGGSCERVVSCYERLSTNLCTPGDATCTSVFEMESGYDETACARRLEDVRQTAQPFIVSRPNYQFPNECAALQ